MTRISEKRDVQDALVNHLIGIGWEYLPPNEIRDFQSLRDFGSLKGDAMFKLIRESKTPTGGGNSKWCSNRQL